MEYLEKSDPLGRLVCDNIASKICGLSKAVISQLTDDEAYDIVIAKLSRLPKTEVERIVEAEIDRMSAPIEIVLRSILFPKKDKQLTPEDDIIPISPWFDIIIPGLFAILGVTIAYSQHKTSLSKSHDAAVAATATAQEVKQRLEDTSGAVVPNTCTGIYTMLCKLQGVELPLPDKEKQIR